MCIYTYIYVYMYIYIYSFKGLRPTQLARTMNTSRPPDQLQVKFGGPPNHAIIQLFWRTLSKGTRGSSGVPGGLL